MTAAPLAGIRVLDLTNVLAGPFCTYQLALMGADVVKVERPGKGDLARELGADPARNERLMGASFVAQNAGKRSLTLDLKRPEAKVVFARLVEHSDVVVENFRPGVMQRLGFGWPELRRIKPSLVYCAISGFGQTGVLAQNPAYDQIIQGLCGVMSITGTADSAPLRVGYPVADTMGGITAAFAIAAALVRARSTGQGECIDVSMLESMLAAMGWAVSNWLIAGRQATPMGNENVTASPSGTFRTAKGLLNIAANKQQQFEVLCRLIDRPDLPADRRFATRQDRLDNRAALHELIESALRTKDATTWAARFNRAGVPAGEVLSVPEILAHPQITERQFLRRFDDGTTVTAGGFTLADDPRTPIGPAPALGADTDGVLAEAGFSAAEIADLRAREVI